METAMACDLLVCTPDARFGEPEIRYGSGPVALLMPYVLGQRLTRELLLTGDTIDADQALRVGLVNRVVPAEEIEAEVSRLVARIAPTPLPVLKLTKLALNRAYLCMGLAEAVEANLDLSALLNSAGTPEQEQFDTIVRTEGLRAALAWRDQRYGEVLGALGIKE
jgi:enoyl-CoA hydratase/carnithine racemase